MKPLRSGYTTGACAAAAAKGAALLLRNGSVDGVVTLTLPSGDLVDFSLHSAVRSGTSATCSVIKDAGDDPDVTNGAEVCAVAGSRDTGHGAKVIIEGGCGIGKVTKPGLAVPPGQWAINPVPCRMIEQAVREVFPDGGITITISIPDGVERARKTLNARLGIIGGLSILGTTGIVRPVSAQAWTDTIDTALDVAKACNCPTVVLCTGRTSEMAAMQDLHQGPGACFPEEAFIMMGDHVAHALKSCVQHKFMQPVLACQFAKLVKIACGHPNTHAANSQMELTQLSSWLRQDGAHETLIEKAAQAHTARELVLASNYAPVLLETVCRRVLAAARIHAPGLTPTILICGYDGSTTIPYPHQTSEK